MTAPRIGGLLAVGLFLYSSGEVSAHDRPTTIAPGKPDERGILVHAVESAFQAGTTAVRVLLPDKRGAGVRFPVVYVLPVEARDERRYGDGLLEARRLDLADRFRAIFVAPTFSHLPWYADHPTDPEIRQETYLLKVVIPFVERQYPARTDRDGRLLLGFSKSGWGAWSVLLRHPDVFGKAAAWDAPLMMDRPGPYGSGAIFGTSENFEAYWISTLLERRAADVRDGTRLSLLGHANFRDEHERAHALMASREIPHVYVDGPKRAHLWESGWVLDAVKALLPED